MHTMGRTSTKECLLRMQEILTASGRRGEDARRPGLFQKKVHEVAFKMQKNVHENEKFCRRMCILLLKNQEKHA
jgi:hypothetical protein